MNIERRSALLSLAHSHHVVVRAFQALHSAAAGTANNELIRWTHDTLEAEHARIENALSRLESICAELKAAGCPVVVIKSLDHWPDLGNDIDLFTLVQPAKVIAVMRDKFQAQLEPRSWGDRLAGKWNFAVPGLPELIEIHMQRLGQTGEHMQLATRIVNRRASGQFDGCTFEVPAPEERVLVSTLQRMYRHFYLRICDVLDNANLVESGNLDFDELRRAAEAGGIWAGVATYLRLISDYLKQYRGAPLDLPREVVTAAKFNGERVFVRDRFLRFPVMPEAAELYTLQVTSAARRGDLPAAFRLSLLPPLASAAAISYKLTGSDKGIW